MKFAFLIIFISVFSSAQEIKPDSQSLANTFWLSGNLGLDVGARGFIGDGPLTYGLVGEVNARYQVDDYYGVVGIYKEGTFVFNNRHSDADIRNSMYGLGLSIRISEPPILIGSQSFMIIHFAGLYGQSQFSFHDNKVNSDFAKGTKNGWGLDLGADLYFPLFSKIWAFGGVALQTYQFNYDDVPQDSNGDDQYVGHLFFVGRVGLSYQF